MVPCTVRLTLLEGKNGTRGYEPLGGDVFAVLVQCSLPGQRLGALTFVLVAIHMFYINIAEGVYGRKDFRLDVRLGK
jgi:hypothetical protein